MLPECLRVLFATYSPRSLNMVYSTNLKRFMASKKHSTLLDETEIHCSPCCSTLRVSENVRKYCVESHERGGRHKNNLAKWNRCRQDPTKEILSQPMNNEFYADIAELLTTANIPFDKLNNPTFDRFFAKWCGKNCPDPPCRSQARDTATAANCLPIHRRRTIFWASPRKLC